MPSPAGMSAAILAAGQSCAFLLLVWLAAFPQQAHLLLYCISSCVIFKQLGLLRYIQAGEVRASIQPAGSPF